MSDQKENGNYGAAPPNGTQTPWASAPPAPPVPPGPSVPAPQPVQQASTAKRNGGIWAGVFLIAIGLVFLAGQVIPGLAWWNMWPLIVVLVGVIQMFTPNSRDEWGVERLMDGLGTVVFGLVLLGNTLGIVSWTVWWVFITLWPVLLVSLGVHLLGRGLQQSWLRALAPVLVWIALGYAVSVSLTGATGYRPFPALVRSSASGQPFAYSEPQGNTTSAALLLKGGAGEIVIRGGDSLVTAAGTSPFGTPTFTVDRRGDTANVEISQGDSSGVVIVPGVTSSRTEVALSRTTVWDATFETGATSLNADLSDVPVRDLVLKTGASSATLKLGQVPSTAAATNVAIKAGVSSVEVLVPRDAAVQVATHNGLSAMDVDERLVSAGSGLWQTPGFSSANKVITITVESGISSISVRTY
jgi:hypothetical protein